VLTAKLFALLVTLVLALCVLAPQPAYAQLGGITGLFNVINGVANQVLSFINNTMRPILESVRSASQAIQGFLSQLRNLWEQVVWPVSEINRARALAASLIGTFRGLLNGMYAVTVNSAQLRCHQPRTFIPRSAT
jgi:hypothetical protein